MVDSFHCDPTEFYYGSWPSDATFLLYLLGTSSGKIRNKHSTGLERLGFFYILYALYFLRHS